MRGFGCRPCRLPKLQQVGDRDLPLADAVEARLHDADAHRVKASDEYKLGVGPECVEHGLRVVLGVDRDALAVLQVHNLDTTAAQNYGVGSAKAPRNPLREVHAPLDEDAVTLLGQSADVVYVSLDVPHHV